MDRQKESIKTFNLPFFSGVEAIAGNHIRNEFRRHIHDSYIIGIVDQGARIIDGQDGSTQVLENEIFVLNPGQVHACRSESPSGHSYRALSVRAEIMQSIACQISGLPEKTPFFKYVRYTHEALSDQIKQLFAIMDAPESDLQVESMLFALLAFLIGHFSASPPPIDQTQHPKDSIKRACDYIARNYKAYMSLKQLSDVACLSPFHFQREFKRQIGITPHEFLSDCRIREAKKMLLRSGDIADIAIQLGFFDQSHFSRIFKKAVGVPPGKYRRTNLDPM